MTPRFAVPNHPALLVPHGGSIEVQHYPDDIASTMMRSGLTVRAELNNAECTKGLGVSGKDFAAVRIERNEFHGDWNCRIHSRSNWPSCFLTIHCLPGGRLGLLVKAAVARESSVSARAGTSCRVP